eukprot:12399447-Alexandrium_andersonii.AAC.1
MPCARLHLTRACVQVGARAFKHKCAHTQLLLLLLRGQLSQALNELSESSPCLRKEAALRRPICTARGDGQASP